MVERIQLRVRFMKTGLMRYISHLDFVRLMHRVLRRAEIPYALTCGFNRHPKIKFGPALKLGKEGEVETTFFLASRVDADEFKKKMEGQLTNDIRIVDIFYEK
ncbi:MAG: TIGR03936 family radical SAM-associated protein [Candidatus Omnitrophica bacterium]|nr:TIGR03936 family radical SAM-associated protein [Candidatus Omnitrophota bacterium]MBU4478518.1 TIGR03936 family radical SAM-associated protein [Candidatus Omnitrophota bacterium]